MGHADDDLLDAVLRRRVSIEQVEQRDQALGALEREALGADVVLVDELLEDLGVGELGEDAELLFAVELERGCCVDSIALLQPVALLRALRCA